MAGERADHSSEVDTRRERTVREVDRFRRSAVGMMLAGGMTGLAEVLEPRREQPPIIRVSPGEPPGGRRVTFELDPDDPGGSTVVLRRWID